MIMRRDSSTKKEPWIIWTVFLSVLFCGIIVASIMVARNSIHRGASIAAASFDTSFDSARETKYTQYHDMAFLLSEKEHHVHNDITISISAVKEKSELEVLRISDIADIITSSEDNKAGTTSWLKVYGTGVFKVNLAAAEFVVDNERHYVLVRIPRPKLDPNNIGIDRFEILHFEENKWNVNNSTRSGEELARNQLGEARQTIQEDFESSEQYSKYAEASSKSMLMALIQGINPDVEDIQVDVEFY